MEKLKRNKGITLVALIITIIILLILAFISTVTLTGNNGLLIRAQQSKDKTINSQIEENKILAEYQQKIDGVRNTDNEYINFKEKLIPFLQNKGLDIKFNSSDEEILDRITNLKTTQFIKIAENISSRYSINLNVPDYEKYKNLSEDNFYIVMKRRQFMVKVTFQK